MRKLTNHDIKDLREYERERDEFRTEIISMKKRRRIPVGDILTMVFENTATMRFQIQEMARVHAVYRAHRRRGTALLAAQAHRHRTQHRVRRRR